MSSILLGYPLYSSFSFLLMSSIIWRMSLLECSIGIFCLGKNDNKNWKIQLQIVVHVSILKTYNVFCYNHKYPLIISSLCVRSCRHTFAIYSWKRSKNVVFIFQRLFNCAHQNSDVLPSVYGIHGHKNEKLSFSRSKPRTKSQLLWTSASMSKEPQALYALLYQHDHGTTFTLWSQLFGTTLDTTCNNFLCLVESWPWLAWRLAWTWKANGGEYLFWLFWCPVTTSWLTCPFFISHFKMMQGWSEGWQDISPEEIHFVS